MHVSQHQLIMVNNLRFSLSLGEQKIKIIEELNKYPRQETQM